MYSDDPGVELRAFHSTEGILLGLVRRARNWITIAAPTLPLDLLAALTDAARLGIKVELILQDTGAAELVETGAISQVAAAGAELWQVEALPVRIGLSESAVCFALSGGSGEEDGGLSFPARWSPHAMATSCIETVLRPHCEAIPGADRWAKEPQREGRFFDREPGYCIRCREEIPFLPHAPLCREEYRDWARHRNPYKLEVYCHGCGAMTHSVFLRPLCQGCEAKQRTRPLAARTA